MTDKNVRLDAIGEKLKVGIPPDTNEAMWLYRELRATTEAPSSSISTARAEVCAPCKMRVKVILSVLGVAPESKCGIPDSVYVDFMNFDVRVPSNKPVIQIRWCPWCGGRIDPKRGMILVDVPAGVPPGNPSAT